MKNTVEKKKEEKKTRSKTFLFSTHLHKHQSYILHNLKKNYSADTKKKDIFGQNKNKESPHILPIINKG